jgi:hypothetical protein
MELEVAIPFSFRGSHNGGYNGTSTKQALGYALP